jgi:hypothetical protein
MNITESIANFILSHESQDDRFERFCNQLVGDLEGGAVVLSTSRSWDLGRDGSVRARSGSIYTCCSLSGRVDSKARKDIKRLTTKTKQIDRIYFCSSQDLGESKRDQIEEELRTLVPEGSTINVYGRSQLGEIAASRQSLFLLFYKKEVEDCLAIISNVSSNEGAEADVFGLALATAGHESSDVIRRELYKATIRQILADGKPRNVAECAHSLSSIFRLNKVVSDSAISYQLGYLESEGQVTLASGRYGLTERGREELNNQEVAAVDKLLVGRQRIREEVERKIGHKLSDAHFERIWAVAQERMAHFFFLRGKEMLSLVSRIVEPEEGLGDLPDDNAPLFFVDELAAAVAETSSSSDQKEELRQAFIDLFEGASGAAFEWLLEICIGFVALCSLGVEAETGRALESVFRKTSLVFDTDVVLSLLGEGEPGHEGVLAIVQRWKILGGGIWVAKGVLEELAYHAWIAENDFQEVIGWIPGTPADRLDLIENALVRSFAELLAKKKARRNQWRQYIGQFKGDHKYDTSRVEAFLRENYSFRVLPAASDIEKDLEQKAKEFFLRIPRHKDTDPAIIEDKARRDSTLYAAIHRHIREARERDLECGCLLVSSARRMLLIERAGREFGEPDMVVSIGGMLSLLSLVPGVSVGIGAMKAFLFDARRPVFSGPLERLLLRVIRESQEVEMPWAKRGLLVREFRKRLVEDAKNAGEYYRRREDRRDLEEKALSEEALPRTAEILRSSLDAVASQTKLKEENYRLARLVESLREEVDRYKRTR